jgi:glycosyltransferase involved in cell wall biosynthesis
LNILILNYEYPPLGGGAGIVTKQLAELLAKQGYKIVVLTTWFSGEPEFHIDGNLTVVRLRSKRKHTYQSNPLEMLSWMKMAINYIDDFGHDFNFDICLANFAMPGGEVAKHLKNKRNIPFVILSHGHDIPWFHPKQMFFWHFLFYFKIKNILKTSAANIVLTTQMKAIADKFVGKKYSHKNIIIPNGLEFLHFRKGFNSSDTEINALFVGRLVEQKNPLMVVKAFEKLQHFNLPINLKIIGDGKLKKELENYIFHNQIQNIKILGRMSQSEVFQEMQQAHLLIAPSKAEAMSMSILEGISCGMFVLATNISGNKELIMEGFNGYFVKDEIDIVEKVKLFYNEKFTKNYHYPEDLFKYLNQKYSWNKTVMDYINLFETIKMKNK